MPLSLSIYLYLSLLLIFLRSLLFRTHFFPPTPIQPPHARVVINLRTYILTILKAQPFFLPSLKKTAPSPLKNRSRKARENQHKRN